LKHLELIQRPQVLANVGERSRQLRKGLIEGTRGMPAVKEVRVVGLMGAVELDTSRDALLARRVCRAMVRRGVLSRSMGSAVTLVPPLSITATEIDSIVTALLGALEEAAR
jgi:adenosylmethionine-8-amino-7-oxononanoate aminotransferase